MIDQDRYDVFLSHATPDKPWVRTLCEKLEAEGLRVFLDEKFLEASGNFVGDLSDALGRSRFLVLVLTQASVDRPWVKQEWTAFMAEQGPLAGRLIPVLREYVELPTILKPTQALDAIDGDTERAAVALARLIGRGETLKAGDTRQLYIGQQLPFTLTLEAAGRLRIVEPDGKAREITPPWRGDTDFGLAYFLFQKIAAKALDLNDPAAQTDRAELNRHARTLGEKLFGLLFADQALVHLKRALLPGSTPLVTIRSDNDLLLALPWELLYHDGAFLVRDARLDLTRTTAGAVDLATLPGEPSDHFKLVVNVSAPEGSGLSYEEESYRLTRALTEQCTLTPTELGTVEDLLETVHRETPTGIHFSGHGSPAALLFEDDEGGDDLVPVADLIQRLRTRLPGPLPAFFYLASCHGNEPAELDGKHAQAGAESAAAQLHRAGVAQVVGYYGPIADALSTRTEAALYRAIAEGQTTRYALRQARAALLRDFDEAEPGYRPGAPTREASATPANAAALAASSHPFAWAQLVYYQRGPDFPLSLPADPGQRPRGETLKRTFRDAGNRRLLATGFIGRRCELHRARRAIRAGQRVFVFQGLGGLGKSTLALDVLTLLGGHEDLCTLWCQDTEREAGPAEALAGQLLGYCRERFGGEWEEVVQQVDQQMGEDSAARFLAYLQVLLQSVPRLVLYLDNLESLLIGPESPELERRADAFGAWRSAALETIWTQTSALAENGDRLYLVASCRYDNDAFAGALLPVSPLPDDALFRLMDWFPALNRLSAPAQARLVARLAGHPRAVEYANDLIQDALNRWHKRRGPWRPPVRPNAGELEREWHELVEPALPQVRERLEDNLLLAAIWERVLDDPARRMLYRMTLLRRPWDWDLMGQLGEADEAQAAEATAEELLGTSLLEPVDRRVAKSDGALEERRAYTLHPATARFIADRFGENAPLRLATHRRVGAYLEARASTSPHLETAIDAGHHLFQAGEYDRAYELLGPASRWLQERGWVREGLQHLQVFLEEAVLDALAPERTARLLGTVGNAYANLGQADQAIGYYEQALVIAWEIGDHHSEGNALGSLGNTYYSLGQADQAIGLLEQAVQIGQEIKDPQIVQKCGRSLKKLRGGDD